MTEKTVHFAAEITDTYCGQANYAWVRRAQIEVLAKASNRSIARRVKAAFGYTGVRGRSTWCGDAYEFRPYGECVVIFAQFEY